jgi:dephospho-CoA kinase
MPFADELQEVTIVDYQPRWPAEFACIAAQLRTALGSTAVAIDHVGSTSVPGLAAKDCIDIQVRVVAVDEQSAMALLTPIGFRRRPEPWNQSECSSGVTCSKLVFAPPIGARRCNVHIRRQDAPNARYALLFSDYLRADDIAREAWGEFKKRLATSVRDLSHYGRIKAPATEVLMQAAERWVVATGWAVCKRPPSE